MAARKTSVKKSPAKKATAKKTPPSRMKFEGSADAYFAQLPAGKRALLEKLRALVKKGAPDATPVIKWGVPIYEQNGKMVCALAAFKEHVAINFFAPPDVLADPKGKLEGAGKGSRALKVRTVDDIENESILRWLKAAVARVG